MELRVREGPYVHVIARSETTKQSPTSMKEIASGLRPRNDTFITSLVPIRLNGRLIARSIVDEKQIRRLKSICARRRLIRVPVW